MTDNNTESLKRLGVVRKGMTNKTFIKDSSDTLETFNSNVNVKGMPFVDINFDIYEPRDYGITYKDVNGEAVLLESLIKAGFHTILEGDKGLGKTLMVHDICHSLKIPIVPINCSSATTREDLLGHVVIQKDGTFAFKLGVIPTAILLANSHPTKRVVIYQDEPNTMNPDVQKIWNSVLDDRRSTIANDQIFRVNKDSILVVVGAMNPISYSGVNALNEDYISRFGFQEIKMPSKDTLLSICEWKDLPEEDQHGLLSLSESIRNLRNQGVVDYSLSTRDMNQFATIYSVSTKNGCNHIEAITNAVHTTVIGKMPTVEQRQSVRPLVNDVWGI